MEQYFMEQYFVDQYFVDLYTMTKFDNYCNLAVVLTLSLISVFILPLTRDSRSSSLLKARQKLNEVGDDLLASPQWKVLTQYVTMLDKSKVDENLVWALIRRYGTDGIPSVLAAAKKVPGTKDVATRLEATQMKGWLDSADPSPENILKLLKLGNGADKVFETAQFATWTKYLDEFNTKFPNKKTSQVRVFVRVYGEGNLMKMLVSKGNADSVIAASLNKEMLAKWLEFGTPV
ncbi:hypothetical protein DVH05_010182 [Phytophthora capsici]|nr:hypothetical protein DVH05_010182 [Phytophthora capsici]